MILPNINLSQVESSGVDSLCELLSHWSLFGALALTRIETSHVEVLEKVIKRIGGSVDLNVELNVFDEAAAIKLLNAGASFVICPSVDQSLETIPDDRVRFVFNESEPDQAIPQNHFVSISQPSAERIAELEMARIDCLVPVDSLTPQLIADFFKTVLVSDRPDELWSTLIVDPLGIALGLAYSNYESLLHAIENRVGTYWSRSRDGLWIKGETSGATQQLLNIRMDCDRDCLRFMVTQDPPGFCHRDTHTCFGQERTIHSVAQRLASRINESDAKSFTRKLANDCLLYTSPSPRDATLSRMPSSA